MARSHRGRSVARLWVITSYFNPARYATKRRNYELFLKGLRTARVPSLTVECEFGRHAFELPRSSAVLQLRAKDVLWQKERLLNIAIATLPADCTKVVWLDCDVLFDSPRWAEEVDALLDDHAVVQPFASIVRLPRGALLDDGTGKRWPSFASIYERDPHAAAAGTFAPHGHTGFAWAARREVLAETGLYDACIAGSADHLMAHVFARRYNNACVRRIVGSGGPYRAHFMRWARRTDALVQGSLASGMGTLRHLWHGDAEDRQYHERNQQLAHSSFNPSRDVAIGRTGCWEWRGDSAELREWMIEYFRSRREDG